MISWFSCSHFGLASIPDRGHSYNFATVPKLFGNFRIREWNVWVAIGLSSKMRRLFTIAHDPRAILT